MPTLRERLASLTALKHPPAPQPPSQWCRHSCLRRSGVEVREEVVPFSARRWLAHLPAAGPQSAQIISNLKSQIPTLAHWLFLDLETTGLAGGTGTYAFLIGLAQLAPGGLCLRQYFLRDLAAERELLSALAPQLEAAQLLVSYNGKLFDAPLLETRFRLARVLWPLGARPHLDLLYPARRLWELRCGSARLLDLESSVLGHTRADDVPGELIPTLYFEYLRSGDERPLESVFRHNADDLLTLAALTSRLLQLAAAPAAAHADGYEQLGLAQLFERNGEIGRACLLYEQALAPHPSAKLNKHLRIDARRRLGAGQADSLPDELKRRAQLRLSFLYKRRRDYKAAAALWRELSAGQAADRTALLALEQLAICYEHRLGAPEKALEATRSALAVLDLRVPTEHPSRRARLTYRLQRLTHTTRVSLPL